MTLEWSSSYGPVDEDFANVSLLLKGEGANNSTTILDSSSNNLSVSVVNDAKISTTVATPFSPTVPSDGVLAFDGTGDYLTTTGTVDGTSDVTIECWLYPTDSALIYRAVVDTRDAAPADTGFGVFQYGRAIEVYGNGLKVSTPVNVLTINTWQHIGLVRKNGICQIYLNGDASGSSSAYTNNLTSSAVTIGSSAAATSPYIGYISNLRITKGVARYTENFDVPIAPFPILSPSTRIEVGNGFDVEAANYILAVESADAAAGQTGGLEPAVRTAINDFVVGCKSDGIWNAIKASCLLSGARTLEGALVPLKGSAPTNNGPFVAADYDRKTGLLGNGSTKYLDSNRNNNADPQDSKHFSFLTTTTPGSRIVISTIGTVSNKSTYTTAQGGRAGVNSGLGPGGIGVPVVNKLTGCSRINSTNVNYRTGGIDSTFNATSGIPGNGNISIYGEGSLNCRLAFYSIGESLDLAKLDTRISDFITAIGVAI